MDDAVFETMREILAAPSPVGLEAGMTEGVLAPRWERYVREQGWGLRRFKGNASLVLDTAPGDDDKLKVMFVGHADKIRMQVRDIAADGKIYVNTDSFLPLTLIGNRVNIYTTPPDAADESEGHAVAPSQVSVIEGGTVEALGAIHFASAGHRMGTKGIKDDNIYIELGLHGKNRRGQLEALGLRVGDPVLLDRKISRGFGPDTFSGAYLDNGLGCFVCDHLADLIAAEPASLENVRCMFAVASHEEIGRFGSRVVAAEMEPDVLIAIDVNHDYANAPNVASQRFPKLEMGAGFTISKGSITSDVVNDALRRVAEKESIPYQVDVRGRDTGTDGMAAFLGNIDAASASVGFPIRNMHTISELAHTGDVLACTHALFALVKELSSSHIGAQDLKTMHPRLDQAKKLSWTAARPDDRSDDVDDNREE